MRPILRLYHRLFRDLWRRRADRWHGRSINARLRACRADAAQADHQAALIALEPRR